MRALVALLAAASLTSCMTRQVISRAQGLPGPMDTPAAAPLEPQPAYYALVPLVFPLDLVVWPIELLVRPRGSANAPEPYTPPPRPATFTPGPPPEPGVPFRPGQ